MEEMIGRLDEIAGQLKRIGDALEALSVGAKEGKETFPPTTPYKEKGEVCPSPDTNAHACACEGMVVPTLDEVKAYAASAFIADDIAEDFHTYYDAMGWRCNGDIIRNWRPLLKSWQRARKRFAARDAKLTAHIDAKMDEREAKREQARSKAEAAYGRARKADNWIPSTEAERKGFADALGR